MPEDNGPGPAAFEDDLERFLTAWYGPPARAAEPPGESALPAALEAWHRQVARWDEPMTSLTEVLDERRVWLDGDVLVIHQEVQGAWLWGTVPEIGNPWDDPPVVERENVPHGRWTVTGERLGDFLLHVALLEAILGAPACLALDDATPDQLRRLTADMAVVRVPAWRWPGPRHTLWQRGRVLALTCVNRLPDSPVDPMDPRCTWWVVIGARDSDDLAFARELGIRFDTDTHPPDQEPPAA